MRAHEIESWVLDIIDRVRSNQPIEDTRVELKREWPSDTKKTARRIAGHANAARGESILWVIGVDEETSTVTGVTRENLANWYPQVEAYFDGIAPYLIDLNIPIDKVTVVALLFETGRAPFVFKHRDGADLREIPWREGTRIRSARRDELLRLLSPLRDLPTFEVLKGNLTASYTDAGETAEQIGAYFYWTLHLTLYVEKSTDVLVTIPFHRCEIKYRIQGSSDWYYFEDIKMRAPSWMHEPNTTMINSTPDEVHIFGPGKLSMTGNSRTISSESMSFPNPVALSICLKAVKAERAISFDLVLPYQGVEKGGKVHKWGEDIPEDRVPQIG